MDVLIEELKQKPNLKMLLDKLNQLIREEGKQREAFYNTITESDKAEFINGEIIMHSPVKMEPADASEFVLLLMKTYCMKYQLGKVHTEKIMIHLSRNSYEPDIVFFKKEKSDSFKTGQMLFPVPDLIVEVLSPSTEKNDRGVKFIDYAEHGVQEYWLIDPVQQSAEQYLLKKDSYELEFKSKAGTIFSEALTGFTVEVKALFNQHENLTAMQQLLQY